MLENILKAVVNYVVPLILGYCVSRIKVYKDKLKKEKENENVQNVALLTLLQTQLTNTYFVYSELKQIPDYIYRNWLNLLSVYEQLGGNDYCHTLQKKMESWEIKKTDIL